MAGKRNHNGVLTDAIRARIAEEYAKAPQRYSERYDARGVVQGRHKRTRDAAEPGCVPNRGTPDVPAQANQQTRGGIRASAAPPGGQVPRRPLQLALF